MKGLFSSTRSSLGVQVLSILFGLLLAGCSGNPPDAPYSFPTTPFGEVPQPPHNVASVNGVALGKKLFFDPRLSKTGTVSCAACHHPEKAFSDGVSLTKVGISGKVLLRHSPALFNLAWYEGLFWDGGSKNLEAQVFGPLIHPDEMGADLTDLVEKLQNETEYPELFKQVFGSDTITTQGLARVLAQYERTLLSYSSKYDSWKAGKTSLTELELQGYSIYETECSSCHTEGLFTDVSYHANGIDTAISDRSHELMYWGRYRITNDSVDIGRYKTPSLRNLGFTAPYMHDGRFGTLDEVFAHYFKDHSRNPLADSALKSPRFVQVGEQEKKALKAFLYTLNDSAFVGLKP